MKLSYRKESAIVGMVATIVFIISYFVPTSITVGPLNAFQIVGFTLVLISVANPWYPQIAKFLRK